MADLQGARQELEKVIRGCDIPEDLGSVLMGRWMRYFPAFLPAILRLNPEMVMAALVGLPQVAVDPADGLGDLFRPVNDCIVIPQSDDGFKVGDVFTLTNAELGIASFNKDFEEIAGGIAVDPKPARVLQSFMLRRRVADADIRHVLGAGYETDFAAVRDLLRSYAPSAVAASSGSVLRDHSYTSNVFYVGGLVVSLYHSSNGCKQGWRMAVNEENAGNSKWPEGTRFFRSKK